MTSNRQKVEDTPTLDLTALRKADSKRRMPTFDIVWQIQPNKEFRTVVALYPDKVCVTEVSGEPLQTIPLASHPCNFGGIRKYLVCNGEHGTSCGKRATKLFLKENQFVCRDCLRLVYKSQYESEWARHLRQASALRNSLNNNTNGWEIPTRPKGMWHTTYQQKLKKLDQLDSTSLPELTRLTDIALGEAHE